MRKLLLACLPALLLTARAGAQVEWNVDYNAFLDNREYNNEANGVYPGSLLGAWLTPTLGYRFEEQHALYGGVAVLQEFGTDRFTDMHRYVAYYAFRGKYFDLQVGAFSFADALGDYLGVGGGSPLASDSTFEYTPVMTGVHWQFHRPTLMMNSWLDWVGRYSTRQHEEFLFSLGLRWKPSFWYLGFQSYMRHYAYMQESHNDHITDAGMTHLFAGLDFSNKLVLDSLTLQVGYILEKSRVRDNITPWLLPHGLFVQLQAEWRGLGVKNTFYTGDGQYALYDPAAHDGYGGAFLYWGDPYYRYPLYNRTDFILRFFQSERVQAYFSYSFHYAGGLLSHQQQFMLRVNIGNMQPRLKARREQNLIWKKPPSAPVGGTTLGVRASDS